MIILKAMASALVCLQANSIVHRDIKPENILIKEGVVKLGDFGLCLVGEPTLADKTKIGSLLFMAPESIARFEYTWRSDVYALGVVCLEILCGDLGFKNDSNNSILAQKRDFNLKNLTKKCSISEQLEKLLISMANFDLNLRPKPETILNETIQLMSYLGIPE